jgi:hypothetical protein
MFLARRASSLGFRADFGPIEGVGLETWHLEAKAAIRRGTGCGILSPPEDDCRRVGAGADLEHVVGPIDAGGQGPGTACDGHAVHPDLAFPEVGASPTPNLITCSHTARPQTPSRRMARRSRGRRVSVEQADCGTSHRKLGIHHATVAAGFGCAFPSELSTDLATFVRRPVRGRASRIQRPIGWGIALDWSIALARVCIVSAHRINRSRGIRGPGRSRVRDPDTRVGWGRLLVLAGGIGGRQAGLVERSVVARTARRCRVEPGGVRFRECRPFVNAALLRARADGERARLSQVHASRQETRKRDRDQEGPRMAMLGQRTLTILHVWAHPRVLSGRI